MGLGNAWNTEFIQARVEFADYRGKSRRLLKQRQTLRAPLRRGDCDLILPNRSARKRYLAFPKRAAVQALGVRIRSGRWLFLQPFEEVGRRLKLTCGSAMRDDADQFPTFVAKFVTLFFDFLRGPFLLSNGFVFPLGDCGSLVILWCWGSRRHRAGEDQNENTAHNRKRLRHRFRLQGFVFIQGTRPLHHHCVLPLLA